MTVLGNEFRYKRPKYQKFHTIACEKIMFYIRSKNTFVVHLDENISRFITFVCLIPTQVKRVFC